MEMTISTPVSLKTDLHSVGASHHVVGCLWPASKRGFYDGLGHCDAGAFAFAVKGREPTTDTDIEWWSRNNMMGPKRGVVTTSPGEARIHTRKSSDKLERSVGSKKNASAFQELCT